MHVEIVTDLQQAKELWERFSPGITIYHDWSFRYAFYKYDAFPIVFLCARQDEETVGLLALQRNTQKGYLEFFGGSYMEDNGVFAKAGWEEQAKELLWKSINEPHHLTCIVEEKPERFGLQAYETKFTLPLTGAASVDECLLSRWSTKSRNEFKRRIKKIDALSLQVRKNQPEDLEYVFELNKERFGADSSFHEPHREDVFRDLAREWGDRSYLLAYTLEGKVCGASFGLVYKNRYTYMNAGVASVIENFSAYLTVKNMEQALALKLALFDAFTQDCGWKTRWHFDQSPQYALIKTT